MRMNKTKHRNSIKFAIQRCWFYEQILSDALIFQYFILPYTYNSEPILEFVICIFLVFEPIAATASSSIL